MHTCIHTHTDTYTYTHNAYIPTHRDIITYMHTHMHTYIGEMRDFVLSALFLHISKCLLNEQINSEPPLRASPAPYQSSPSLLHVGGGDLALALWTV